MIEMAARSDVRNLEYTLVAVAIFSGFVVYESDPSGFGPLFVGGVAYLASLCLLLAGFGSSKRGRSAYILMVVLGIVGVLLVVYASTDLNGLPAQASQISYSNSCTTTQMTNSTSPSGFANETICTSVGSPYYSPWGLLYNLAFWTPLVGAVVYAMPSWIEPKRRNVATSLSRLLKGAVPVGTLILLTFGLGSSSSGFPELFNGHSPINPFVAYNACDSTTFGVVGCVQTNVLSYLTDYAFWITVVALAALIISEMFDMVKKAIDQKSAGRPGPDVVPILAGGSS